MSAPCILWDGRLDRDGYPFEGRHTRVHRRVWADHHGPIPEGYEIDHICNIRRCIEITHLQALTDAEHKAVTKARNKACRKGHRWTPENTRVDPKRRIRLCRACDRDRQAAHRAKVKS